MSARSKARKRALDILFQADVRGEDVALTLAAEARRAASEPAREASWLYAREIVDGVIDNAPAIDEAITAAAKGWTLVRMPAVDRALLRIGTWEIVYNDGVPEKHVKRMMIKHAAFPATCAFSQDADNKVRADRLPGSAS